MGRIPGAKNKPRNDIPLDQPKENKQVGALAVDINVPTRSINGIEYIVVDESVRIYDLPNGRQLQIDNVRYVNISKSGGHRIITADNKCFYIKPKESWFMTFDSYTSPGNQFIF